MTILDYVAYFAVLVHLALAVFGTSEAIKEKMRRRVTRANPHSPSLEGIVNEPYTAWERSLLVLFVLVNFLVGMLVTIVVQYSAYKTHPMLWNSLLSRYIVGLFIVGAGGYYAYLVSRDATRGLREIPMWFIFAAVTLDMAAFLFLVGELFTRIMDA